VHHGFYVGNSLVVHYGGLVRGLRAGPIEVVSVEQFTQGGLLRVVFASSPYFSGRRDCSARTISSWRGPRRHHQFQAAMPANDDSALRTCACPAVLLDALAAAYARAAVRQYLAELEAEEAR
jgi:hypothetical protein